MFEGAIAKGIEYLDEHEPGWDQVVDVDRLNMGWGDSCVLGQLDRAREPEEEWSGYNHYLHTRRLSSFWAEEHGFLVDESMGNGDPMVWRRIKENHTAEWKQAILTHRAESQPEVGERELVHV